MIALSSFTAAFMVYAFVLHVRGKVDKENGGKADALNAGLCFCRTPLFCAMDADTLLERDALTQVVRPFLEDSRTVAEGGIIRIANGCTIEGGARYGRIGMVAMPHFYFLEMWGPLLEVMGYVVFILTLLAGWTSATYVSAFLMVTVVLGIALSVSALALEEMAFRRYPRLSDLLRLFVLAVVENFGYRQLTAFWRVRGLIRFLRKTKGWGVMPRIGFKKPAEGGS